MDTDALLETFRETTAVTFAFVRGAGGPATDLYEALRHPGGAAPYPVDVILDPDGVIVYLAVDVNMTAMFDTLGAACEVRP